MLAAARLPTGPRGRRAAAERYVREVPAADSPEMNVHRGGRGEPLLLLHGIGATLRSWSAVIPALELSHDVLAVDLPGFGESPPLPPERRPSVPALADAIERALADAGLDAAHVAGSSLGGWIALELARRGRARSVVAFSPAGMWTRREVAYVTESLKTQHAIAARLAPHADVLTRTAIGRTLLGASMMSRPWRADATDLAYTVRAFAAAPGWRDTLAWMSSHRAEGLEEVRCPVLIAWGSLDTLLLPRQGPRFTHRIPDAELRALRRLGHLPMSDDPELVARTITEFADRADPGGAGTAGP